MEEKPTNKKVVVTGGAGFIGTHLVNELVKQGLDVHVIDNLCAGKKENINPDAILHKVDIRDLDEIAKIISSAEFVFHLAALPRVQFSIDNPIETNDVNIGGTLNVLLAAKESGVKRFIYSASSSAYGDQPELPLHEGLMPDPKSPYGLQKHVGELYCKVFSEVYGLQTVSLRYFNVYGRGQDPDGPYALVIGKFLKQRAEDEPMTITGDGEQTRDFTHISDIVNANILAMESEKVGRGEVFNIGYGKDESINRVSELIGGPVEHVAPRIEPRHTRADNSKAKKLLGWEPKIDLETGINELKNQKSEI